MYDDPIVNDVRKTRERLAEKYDFDVSAIFKDLRKRQGMLGKKLVRRARKGFAERIRIDRESEANHDLIR